MNPDPTFQPVEPAPPFVRPGESVVWTGQPTLLVLVSQTVGLGFFLLVFAVPNLLFVSDAPAYAVLAPIGLFVLFALIVGLQAARLRRARYVLTRQALYARTGLIGQTVIQTTYDKITDIALRQDVLGRVFGYSSLNVNTAGSDTAPLRLDGLRNALEIKALVEQTRDAYLARREAPATGARPGAIPRFVPDRLLMRVQCPTTRRPFKRPRTDAGRNVPCPHCQKSHVAKEARAARGRP